MSLHTMVFMSIPRRAFGDDELAALSREIQTRYATRGIASILLYTPQYFFEVLEGEPFELDLTFGRICRDPRHWKISLLLYMPIRDHSIDRNSLGVFPSRPNHDLDRMTLDNIAHTAYESPENAGEAAIKMLSHFYSEIFPGPGVPNAA